MSSNTVPVPILFTSNDSNTNSKLCDGESRCCNSESKTDEKDKTLHIVDSEAKTEDQLMINLQADKSNSQQSRSTDSYERKQT